MLFATIDKSHSTVHPCADPPRDSRRSPVKSGSLSYNGAKKGKELPC